METAAREITIKRHVLFTVFILSLSLLVSTDPNTGNTDYRAKINDFLQIPRVRDMAAFIK